MDQKSGKHWANTSITLAFGKVKTINPKLAEGKSKHSINEISLDFARYDTSRDS